MEDEFYRERSESKQNLGGYHSDLGKRIGGYSLEDGDNHERERNR